MIYRERTYLNAHTVVTEKSRDGSSLDDELLGKQGLDVEP